MKLIGFLFLAISVYSQVTSASPIIPGQGFLIGDTSPKHNVLIRQIDKGSVLWKDGYQLSNRSSISQGPHIVYVTCEFIESWGKRILQGKVSLNVKPSTTYYLSGSEPVSGEECKVRAVSG